MNSMGIRPPFYKCRVAACIVEGSTYRASLPSGSLAWGSGPRGAKPDYTGLDVIIVRDDKIAALYVFLDPSPS